MSRLAGPDECCLNCEHSEDYYGDKTLFFCHAGMGRNYANDWCEFYSEKEEEDDE